MKFASGLWLCVLMSGVAFAQLPEGEARLPVQTETEEQPPAPVETKPEEKATEEEKVYLNVQDQDIKEIVKQISKATGRNFIIDAKVSGKITILSNRMMTKNEAYQAFLSSLEVAGFTLVEGPGGILKIIPLRDAKNYPIPTHVDTTPLSDQYITRLIKLENISASEMAEAIKGLISRNGNLFAYPETNTLVLTDSGTNIDRLMKIIKELDQEGPQETVEIIPLHYASAKEVAGIVLTLFEQEKGQPRTRAGAAGAQEIVDVSKIIADERTNSIIVLASKRAIDGVKELINRLDAKLEEGAEGKIHVHYLKHAKAADIAEVLANLAGQTAKPAGQAGAQQQAGTIVAELEDFKVAADETTNSLLITSTPKTYSTLVDKVLNKLDIPRKQVYLEAMIIEFILSRQKALGVSAHGGAEGAGALGFGQTFRQLAGLINPLGSGTSPLTAAPGLLGGILSRRTVNIQTTDSSGNATTVTVPAFSAFLTALSAVGDTNIVASPNLLALDNEESTIEILRKEPEPGQNIISATGAVQVGTPSRIEAGLTLKLTPQITEKGTVRMDIDQKFSFFATPQNTALGTQAIAERKVKTSVVTNDGQTVVIGGLMQDEVRKTKSKIPVLGDIPILGFLFRQT
ncbi:MAG: type II secretion system secretin GspD, partial [Deltaproteobacteria bacterium]|nr:type II secretion system secretin GspD [Deltaproteobacteria bacterium]